MNDIHTSGEWIYRSRWIAPFLREAVREHPVVVLTGARQVGKSTLLAHETPFRDWRYTSMDDFDALDQARERPEELWAGASHVVLDEVQRVPAVLHAIKRTVDRDRAGTRFVLSGSANLMLLGSVSESLAGRAVYLHLGPMTAGEIAGNAAPTLLTTLLSGEMPEEARCAGRDPAPDVLRGFMAPLPDLSGPSAWVRWWEGYVATYLERDLRQISNLQGLADYRRVMMALALRSGNLLNQTEVGRDTGVPQPTVHRYINLLEASCMFTRLAPFSRNRTKRLIKTPKAYWIDPGLATYLAGLHDVDSVRSARENGALFETLVLHHLRVLCELLTPRARLHCWRTVTGHEVDFVVEQGRRLLAIEAKLTSAPGYKDARHLKIFIDEYPETTAGIVIHAGNEIRRLGEKIVALPWTALAGLSG